LFYSNLIIKTLSGPSYYRKSFYEEDNEEIPNVGNWQNSTIVLENQFTLIKNFIIYNNIYLEIPENKINLCFSNLFKFINTLIKEGIVQEKIVTQVSNFKKKGIKTHKYWSIVDEINLINLISETNFSSIPYKLINKNNILYEKGCHFSKIILVL